MEVPNEAVVSLSLAGLGVAVTGISENLSNFSPRIRSIVTKLKALGATRDELVDTLLYPGLDEMVQDFIIKVLDEVYPFADDLSWIEH